MTSNDHHKDMALVPSVSRILKSENTVAGPENESGRKNGLLCLVLPATLTSETRASRGYCFWLRVSVALVSTFTGVVGDLWTFSAEAGVF